MPRANPVLRPRCWSGRKKSFSLRLKAQSNAPLAFDEVQTRPPRSPQKALIAGCRIHVGDGRDAVALVVGEPELHELLPGIFDLADLRHVGHGAAGVEIGKQHRLSGTRQDVGALRHEMHAAEDDVAAFGLRRHLRQAVGVAAIIGKTHDFIALIVMSEDHALAAQLLPGCGNAFVHRVIGEYEIVFERAGCRFCYRCCSHLFVSAFSPGDVSSVESAQQSQKRRLSGNWHAPERGC